MIWHSPPPLHLMGPAKAYPTCEKARRGGVSPAWLCFLSSASSSYKAACDQFKASVIAFLKLSRFSGFFSRLIFRVAWIFEPYWFHHSTHSFVRLHSERDKMGNRSFYQITALLILLDLTCAIPWAGPAPTPTGLMAQVGMSPWPTEAPGLNGIPKELLRRQQVPFPPPLNWCGFVNGNPSTYNIQYITVT